MPPSITNQRRLNDGLSPPRFKSHPQVGSGGGGGGSVATDESDCDLDGRSSWSSEVRGWASSAARAWLYASPSRRLLGSGVTQCAMSAAHLGHVLQLFRESGDSSVADLVGTYVQLAQLGASTLGPSRGKCHHPSVAYTIEAELDVLQTRCPARAHRCRSLRDIVLIGRF